MQLILSFDNEEDFELAKAALEKRIPGKPVYYDTKFRHNQSAPGPAPAAPLLSSAAAQTYAECPVLVCPSGSHCHNESCMNFLPSLGKRQI